MTKFKVGDKIVPNDDKWTCLTADTIGASYAVITRITLLGSCCYDLYNSRGEKISSCGFCQNDNNSKLKEKTMENLQKGDVLVDKDGYERTVVYAVDEIVFTAGPGDETSSRGVYPWSLGELKHSGIHLKADETTTELTMDEIADKFGLNVANLKIKKN